LITAGSWGLFWIPQRAFEANGLTGGWGTIAQMYVPLLMLAPMAIWRKIKGKSFGLDYPLIGLLMGGGIACYANSFLLTDVVRALILFYMTPVWATLYELLFRKQKPQWHRAVTIVLALSGVWIVFSQGLTFPVPQNIGDWVALVGGMLFAGGAVRTEMIQPKDIFSLLISFFFCGGLVTLVIAYFLGDTLGPMPSNDAWIAMLPWLLLMSAVFLIPTNIVLLWTPSVVGGGLYSIIILIEIVVGSASAAVLTDESFGWREIVGSMLIITAGLTEIVLAPKASQNEE
jgi:drug/metabolite transporter (DMT)-like permease